jgi:hypothetical protein
MQTYSHTTEADLVSVTEHLFEPITGEELDMIGGGQAVTNSI